MNSDSENDIVSPPSGKKQSFIRNQKRNAKGSESAYGESSMMNGTNNSDDDRDDKAAEQKRIDAAMETLELAKAKARAQREEYGEYLNWKVTMQRTERKQHEEEEKRLRARVGEKLKSVLAEHKAAKRAELTAYLHFAKGTAADVREALFQTSPTEKPSLSLKENVTSLNADSDSSKRRRSTKQEPHQLLLNDSYLKEDEFYEQYLQEQDRRRDEWAKTKEVLGANYRRRATTVTEAATEGGTSKASSKQQKGKGGRNDKSDPLEGSQSNINISTSSPMNQKPQRPKVVAGVEIMNVSGRQAAGTNNKNKANSGVAGLSSSNGYVPVDIKNFSLQNARSSAALATNLAVTRRAQVLQLHMAKLQQQQLEQRKDKSGPLSNIDGTMVTEVPPQQKSQKRRRKNKQRLLGVESDGDDEFDDDGEDDSEYGTTNETDGDPSYVKRQIEDEEGVTIREYSKMMEPFLADSKKENSKIQERQKMQLLRSEADESNSTKSKNITTASATAAQSTVSSRSKFASESKNANASRQQQLLSEDEGDQLHRNQIRKTNIDKHMYGDAIDEEDDDDDEGGNYTAGKPKLSRRERKLLSDITQKRFMLELRTTKINDMMMKARSRRELATQRIAADPPADFLVGEHIQSFFSVDNHLGLGGALITMNNNKEISSKSDGSDNNDEKPEGSNWFLTQQQDMSLTETQIRGKKGKYAKSGNPMSTKSAPSSPTDATVPLPSIPVSSRLIQVHHLPRTTKTHWHPKFNPYGWMGVPLSANQQHAMMGPNGSGLGDDDDEDYNTKRKREQEAFLYNNSYKSNFESVVEMALESTATTPSSALKEKSRNQREFASLPSPPKSAPVATSTAGGPHTRSNKYASTVVVSPLAIASSTPADSSQQNLTISVAKFPARNVKEERAWLDWHEVHNRMLEGNRITHTTSEHGNQLTESSEANHALGAKPPLHSNSASQSSPLNERQINGKTLIAQQQDRKEDLNHSSSSQLRTSINHRNLNISLLSSSGVGGAPPPSSAPLLSDSNIERGVGAPRGYVALAQGFANETKPNEGHQTSVAKPDEQSSNGWKFNSKAFLPPVKSIKMDPDLETHGKFLKLDRERRNR